MSRKVLHRQGQLRQQQEDAEKLCELRQEVDHALERWESQRDAIAKSMAAKPKTAKPKTAKPKTAKPNTAKTDHEEPKKNTPKTHLSNIDRPRSKPFSSGLDDPLNPSSSAGDVQSQAKMPASHLRSDRIMTLSDCKAPGEAQGSPVTSSSQHKHTAKKATSAEDANLTSSPKPRPEKRKASSAADRPKEAKRARVEKGQSNGKSKKDSGTKTAANLCSPEALSPRPTAGCAEASRAKEAANAAMDVTVSSPGTRPFSIAVDDVEGHRHRTDNRTRAPSTSLSFKTPHSKTAPGGATTNDKAQADTTPAIGGSSVKQASATMSQKSTQGVGSENTGPARQESSPKPLVADRGDNAKGSKDPQETSSVSISKELPNISLPASRCSTEGGSQGEADVSGPGAVEVSRDEQEANDISSHQGSSDIGLPEPARGSDEGRNEDEAAVTDVVEVGLDAESQAERDEEPDKRIVALFGIAVGVGAAAAQFFGA